MNKGIVDIFEDLDVSPSPSFSHEGTPCWLWEGRIHPKGYGDMGRNLAHRVAWEMANGEIPAGHEIHHLCLVKRCCNPLHLTATTPLAHQQSHVDGTPLAHVFLDALLLEGELDYTTLCWIAVDNGCGRNSASAALRRMLDRGEIVRVRRGWYAAADPATKSVIRPRSQFPGFVPDWRTA